MVLRRPLSIAVALAVLLVTAGCSEIPGLREELSVMPPTDCDKPAGQPGGFDYWYVGLTPEPVYWRGCDKAEALLMRSQLGTSELPRINLSGADLRGADLRAANLSYADLRGADLENAKLLGVNVRWANLSGANLRGTDLTGVELYGTRLDGATWSDGSLCQEGSVGRCRRE